MAARTCTSSPRYLFTRSPTLPYAAAPRHLLALWDDFLPPIPVAVQQANVRAVVERLVTSIGGRAVGPAASG